eukprot:gnl/Spiro4/10468_TR5607_c0_g1_i1.p3 gnl/Spiro4/10468_TR5607_c0_g1~~gnl/Spiro4/10468_TR5607_c0_g1_i1.p3  ORF type:complete len:292 (+),score=-43.54 gnl/Spiro4/10468_TR5607_c0_g1_i1:3332-4207(+)
MFFSIKLTCVFYTAVSLFVLFYFSHVLPLQINVFTDNNGGGTEVDGNVVASALREMGHVVYKKHYDPFVKAKDNEKGCKVDINIFIQAIKSDCLKLATKNWFIPNAEIGMFGVKELRSMDLILCRTHDAERIFKQLGMPTFYLGFTGNDCFLPGVEKNFLQCLHLAGKSPFKGTPFVINAWKDQALMPRLVGVITPTNAHASLCISSKSLESNNFEWTRGRLSENELRNLQNSCGVHLCPSIAEGYGHYIVEAMSVGAVVLTTDAPPMNEFITDKRCLIPYTKKRSYEFCK